MSADSLDSIQLLLQLWVEHVLVRFLNLIFDVDLVDLELARKVELGLFAVFDNFLSIQSLNIL